jgi:hypothetical protein
MPVKLKILSISANRDNTLAVNLNIKSANNTHPSVLVWSLKKKRFLDKTSIAFTSNLRGALDDYFKNENSQYQKDLLPFKK